MKKHRYAFVTVVVGALVCMLVSRGVAGQEKAEVCHVTGTTEEGVLVGQVITIADPALQTHVDHGDPTVWSYAPEIGPEACTPAFEADCPAWTFQELAAVGTYCIGDATTVCEDDLVVDDTTTTPYTIERYGVTDSEECVSCESSAKVVSVYQHDGSDPYWVVYVSANGLDPCPGPDDIRVSEVTTIEAYACLQELFRHKMMSCQ